MVVSKGRVCFLRFELRKQKENDMKGFFVRKGAMPALSKVAVCTDEIETILRKTGFLCGVLSVCLWQLSGDKFEQSLWHLLSASNTSI